MIKARGIAFLDGDFGYERERFSYRADGGKWFVVDRGPRYVNTHEVTEHDADGLTWLTAHDRTADPVERPAATEKGQ